MGCQTTADIIVLVFILWERQLTSPDKVFIPDMKAGCSLAESYPADEF